jgi:anti-anti-sigma factor
MNITYRLNNNILYIALDGRVDAANAQEVEKKIFEIKDAHPNTHTVIDADNLAYISSAGLRIILRLKKADANLAIALSTQKYLEDEGITVIMTRTTDVALGTTQMEDLLAKLAGLISEKKHMFGGGYAFF